MRPGQDYTDDSVLVDALRTGDEHAFAWLIDRYSASLHRLARLHVSSSAIADEVLQETWLGVVTGIGRFEHRSSLKTWLYRILLNIARTKGVREQRSIPFSSLASELAAEEPAVDPTRFQDRSGPAPGHWAAPPNPWDEMPEARLLASETLRTIEVAIGQLPPTQQLVVTLRDLEGWSAAEVCNALELSETNQRVLLHRARAKLRQVLENHFEDVAS
ncbi:MAG TPA: RNA polymerase sigma factor [Acidimicrobiia bacterium]